MVELRIELPLPIDITGTLINIIGLTWPGAMIKNGASGSGWRSDNRLVLEIPDEQRHKSPKKAEKYAKRKSQLDADTEATINKLGPNAVSMGLPEHLASIFLAMAKTWLEAYPDAKNYMETKIYDRETYKSWVFTVARSEKQTPHQLRQDAMQERDDAWAQYRIAADERDELKRQLDAVPWEYVPKDIYDRAYEAAGDTSAEAEAPDHD